MKQLTNLSASSLVEGIKKRLFSAQEVMEAHLKKIQEVNPLLNAIIQQLDPDEAMKLAKEADEAVARGEVVGKLHGLPITVKDAFKVKGFICSKGCQGFYKQVAIEDATVITRLRSEGGIIIGLTNVAELLLTFETDNLLYGQTRNPYDFSTTPGGSSGGEAAIIAGEGSPLGLATDGGGSIRQPAHNCGIVGIKPTHGLVPLTGGLPEDGLGLVSPLVAYGPMARYVDDLILTLPIIAGQDPLDPYSVPVSLKDPMKVNLKNLRLAYYSDNGLATPTKETVSAIKEASEWISSFVRCVDENRPDLEKTYELLVETFYLWGDEGKGLNQFIKMIGLDNPSPLVKEFIEGAKKHKTSVTELRIRLVEWDKFRINMLRFMQNYDVIICPVAATPAKKHGVAIQEVRDFTYTMTYNLTGWPAATVRCGTSQEGLPIGVQIIGKPWEDEVVLAVAKKLEEGFGGWKPSLLLERIPIS